MYNLNVTPQFCALTSGAEPQLRRVECSLTDALLHAFPDAAKRDQIRNKLQIAKQGLSSILQLTKFITKKDLTLLEIKKLTMPLNWEQYYVHVKL